MQFNPSKCFVMKITRKPEPVLYDYKLMGHTLQSVSQHPCLGVELSSTIDCSHHINSKVNIASLEYASQVWDPWMDKHIKQIEAVQRRSVRYI